MRRTIVNEHTARLAKEEMILAYRETYLLLQRYLARCLSWTTGEEERKKIKNHIKEVGQNYLRVKESLNF